MVTSDDHDSLLRLLVGLAIVLLLFPLMMMAFAFPMMGGWMMGGRYGPAYAMPLWGWFVVVTPLVLLLVLGYFVYRSLNPGSFGRDPALVELRTAYARGDITEEEFEQRWRRLREEN